MLTADAAFEEQARATFGASPQIALTVVSGTIDTVGENAARSIDATVAVIDLDASMPGRDGGARTADGADRHLAAGDRRHPELRRDTWRARLLQMRVADFMVKPVSPVELVRTCARVAKTATASAEGDRNPKSTPSCPLSAAPA